MLSTSTYSGGQTAHLVCVALLILLSGCTEKQETVAPASAPEFLLGTFEDDYYITYEISATKWTQHPSSTYHISEWHAEDQFMIAQNDSLNSSAAGLWTRIDWMKLENMDPFTWAFCLAAYEAATMEDARNTITADRSIPKTGCGSHPFSRMQVRISD